MGPPLLYSRGPGRRSMVTPNSCCSATPLQVRRTTQWDNLCLLQVQGVIQLRSLGACRALVRHR